MTQSKTQEVKEDLIELVGELFESIEPDGSTDGGDSLTFMGNIDVSTIKKIEFILGIPGHFSKNNFDRGYEVKEKPYYKMWETFHRLWRIASLTPIPVSDDPTDFAYNKESWMKLQNLIELAIPRYEIKTIGDSNHAVEQINMQLDAVRAFKKDNFEYKNTFYHDSVGSIINAYREGDISFDTAVDLLVAKANVKL